MKGNETPPVETHHGVADLEQECSETEKGGKGTWQTPTEGGGKK